MFPLPTYGGLRILKLNLLNYNETSKLLELKTVSVPSKLQLITVDVHEDWFSAKN